MVEESRSRTLYIGGEFRDSESETSIPVVNPATEATITNVPAASDSEVGAACRAAENARIDWAMRPARERGDLLRSVGDVIRDHVDELAEIVVREQGKPLEAAREEVVYAADNADYVAEWDRRLEGEIVPSDRREESIHLLRKPVGVVASITPWNYPVALFLRKVAPALLTGNTVVAKPSEVTPLSTIRLVELIDDELDVPSGVCNLVTGGGRVGSRLVDADEIDMVTMTGSVETGKRIMKQAADDLTRVSLELGGNAPAIVWHDADLDAAVEDLVVARISNAGQVCTCAERVYVHEDVSEEFTRKYVAAMEDVTMGDPFSNPDMGPHVDDRELEKTERAVATARSQGATIATGGSRPTSSEFESGYWYEPTVVTDVGQDMDVVTREIFGPVTPIVTVGSLDEAIANANDTRYGLSAFLFTSDYRTAMRVVDELAFGETYVNRTMGEALQGFHVGWKESGLGGEDGKHGVLKYTQLKSVYHDWS
ncbi:MAG: aldehyde dehydrogenase [Haloarculaceae archaeon]